MKNLLVIIDPQNDFTHRDGHYATRHEIIQITSAKTKINLLIASNRYDTVIVMANYKSGQFIPEVSLAIPGTFGHQIDADIIVKENTSIFIKQEHSCFSSSEFKEFVSKSDYENILICGFLADYCILQTSLDAIAAGYKVFLFKDAIGTGDDVQYRRENIFIELAKKAASSWMQPIVLILTTSMKILGYAVRLDLIGIRGYPFRLNVRTGLNKLLIRSFGNSI